MKAAEKHQESFKYQQLGVNHKSNYVNTALLKMGVIISPHLCLKKGSLCLWPDKAPHHHWFTLRGVAALWGLFRGPEVSLPRFLLCLVSGCFAPPRGTIVLSAPAVAKWFPPVHTLLLVLLASGGKSSHAGLSRNCKWSWRIRMGWKKNRPGGEAQAPCWEAAGALNSESECSAEQWKF